MRWYTCPRRLATATMLGMLAWIAGDLRAQTVTQDTPPATQRFKPAAFSGIQPGTTTMEDVNEAWGRPVKVKRNGATTEHVYRVEPYAAVEVTFHRERVASLAVQLHEAFETSVLAEQMELLAYEPVVVRNESNVEVGLAWPERGVSFGFVAGDHSRQVARIVLDPILVEPFLLRAVARLGTNDTACLDDVRTVLELAPNTPLAFALRARVLRASGHFDEAIAACRSAEAQAPREPEFGLLHAAILADMGHYEHAIAKTRQSLGLCDRRAEMKAAALAQLGNQLASGPKHEYKVALDLHQQAVRQADALLKDRLAEVRTAARDALLEAYLGAASDIAWGPWQSKDTVVPKWLQRAEELVAGAETPEHLAASTITLCHGALEVCAAAGGVVDPRPWVDKLEPVGRRRLETIRDPLASAALAWDLGQAMSAAMQAFQLRNDFAAAQQKGAMAVAYLEMAIPHRQANVADTLSLARVYYRMGSMLAHDMQNDAEAVGWFDRAVPLIEESLPSAAPGECARQGEALVSMAVSYWELGRRERALELTTTGVQCLERAIERGAATHDALAVPYANLASIHEFLGNDKNAKDYAAMAAKIKGTQVK